MIITHGDTSYRRFRFIAFNDDGEYVALSIFQGENIHAISLSTADRMSPLASPDAVRVVLLARDAIGVHFAYARLYSITCRRGLFIELS